jgi:hypothetical protein
LGSSRGLKEHALPGDRKIIHFELARKIKIHLSRVAFGRLG